MNNNNLLARTVIVFVTLAIAGIGLTTGARFLMDAVAQNILIAVGSAIFGASLAFFLIRFFSLIEK